MAARAARSSRGASLLGRALLPALVVVLATALAACRTGSFRRYEFERPAMGTEFRLVFFAPGRAAAEAAADEAFVRIVALDHVLSDYDPGSELARLGARSDEGAPTFIDPGPEDPSRRRRGRRARERRRFDVTTPLTHLWRRARRQEELPAGERLTAARAAVGHAQLALDPETHRVRLLVRGMRLDPGGIGKGFALDAALAVLARHGIERALAVGGGDASPGALARTRAERGPSPARTRRAGRRSAGGEVCRARVALHPATPRPSEPRRRAHPTSRPAHGQAPDRTAARQRAGAERRARRRPGPPPWRCSGRRTGGPGAQLGPGPHRRPAGGASS
jgi:hypothetical protein